MEDAAYFNRAAQQHQMRAGAHGQGAASCLYRCAAAACDSRIRILPGESCRPCVCRLVYAGSRYVLAAPCMRCAAWGRGAF